MSEIKETMIEEVTTEEFAGDAAADSKVKYVGIALAGGGILGLIVWIIRKFRNRKTDKAEKLEKKAGVISRVKRKFTTKTVESDKDSEEANAND